MNTRQLRTLLVVLSLGLCTSTAWSSQGQLVASTTQPPVHDQKSATANSGNNNSAANDRLPSIINEEDLPAFLRTDPCDTGDS